ncbi:hypothetical protein ACYSNX_01770 [Myroides sp. LJL115]
MKNQSLSEIQFKGNWQEYFFKLYQYLYLQPNCIEGLHLLAESYTLFDRERLGSFQGERIIEIGLKKRLPIYMKILELDPVNEKAKERLLSCNLSFYALSSQQAKKEVLQLIDVDKEEFAKNLHEMILKDSFPMFKNLVENDLWKENSDFVESADTLYNKCKGLQGALASIDLDMEMYSALYQFDRSKRDKEVSELIAQKLILLRDYSNYSRSEISSSIVKYADKLVFELEDHYLDFAYIFLESKHIEALLSCLLKYFATDNILRLSVKEVDFWYITIVDLKSSNTFKQLKDTTQIALEELILYIESELPILLSVPHDKSLSTTDYCIEKYPDQAFGYYYKAKNYYYDTKDYELASENFAMSLKNKFTVQAAYYYIRCAYELNVPIKPFAFGEDQPIQMLEYSWKLLFYFEDFTFENQEEHTKAYKLLYSFFKCTWDNFNLYFNKDVFISLQRCSLDQWVFCGEDIVLVCCKLTWYKRALFYANLSLEIQDYLPIHRLKIRCLVALEQFDQAIQYYEEFITSKHSFELDHWSKLYLSSFYLRAKLSKGLTQELYFEAEQISKQVNQKFRSIMKAKFKEDSWYDSSDCEQINLEDEIELSRGVLADILNALPNN